jgi:hypothetical protein
MSPDVAEALAPTATRLGLTAAGAVPLMVLRAGTPVRPGRPVKVARALGPELVGIAGDLAAAAFRVPRDAVARCIDAGITETAGVETYVAWGDDGPVRGAIYVTKQARFAMRIGGQAGAIDHARFVGVVNEAIQQHFRWTEVQGLVELEGPQLAETLWRSLAAVSEAEPPHTAGANGQQPCRTPPRPAANLRGCEP